MSKLKAQFIVKRPMLKLKLKVNLNLKSQMLGIHYKQKKGNKQRTKVTKTSLITKLKKKKNYELGGCSGASAVVVS
jgi:hypothetical protein